jgi:AraC-like DNA-binding protein
VILQHGIAAIPSALYHFQGRLNLYAQHVWFVSYILSHKWDEDLPYPSLGVMARCSGMSKRQLQRYSDELGRMGYLQVYQRVSAERGQEANAYDFAPLFERLEHWIAQGQPLPNAIRATNNLPASDRPGAGTSDMSEVNWRSQEGTATWGDRDPSFVARYGRVISRYGVAAVPRAIFTHQRFLGLEPQQVWFATYIFSYQWDTTLPYPSIVKMAEHTGYTPAYLHRIKGSLVEKGYLRLVHRTNAAGCHTGVAPAS